MNEQPQSAPFTVEEIGEHFGRLLSQAFALEITLTKRIAALEGENDRLTTENEDLRERLHRAELNVLAANGGASIGEAKEKAAG
jgi:regulator of replication initiation timing